MIRYVFFADWIASRMKQRIPPLYALRAFDVAAKTSSFTRAAEEMNLTQSAVSRHIKNLESDLGYELFIRKGPKITLTQKGEMFAKALSKGFKQIEKACALMRPDIQSLKIKTPTSLTSRCLLAPIQAFKVLNPELNVLLNSVLMDKDEVNFLTEDFDCGILLGSGEFGVGTQAIRLFDEQLIPICSPSFTANKGHLGFSAIKASELIHPSHDRRDWMRWLSKFHYPIDIAITDGFVFDSIEQGISIAIQGHGISIADISMIKAEVAAGNLITPFEDVLETGDAYYLVWPENSVKTEIIQTLASFLSRSLRVK